MPYGVYEKGPEDKPYCVYKHDADGKPVGESLGCHPTRKKAERQIRAIGYFTHQKVGRILSSASRDLIQAAINALAKLLDGVDAREEQLARDALQNLMQDEILSEEMMSMEPAKALNILHLFIGKCKAEQQRDELGRWTSGGGLGGGAGMAGGGGGGGSNPLNQAGVGFSSEPGAIDLDISDTGARGTVVFDTNSELSGVTSDHVAGYIREHDGELGMAVGGDNGRTFAGNISDVRVSEVDIRKDYIEATVAIDFDTPISEFEPLSEGEGTYTYSNLGVGQYGKRNGKMEFNKEEWEQLYSSFLAGKAMPENLRKGLCAHVGGDPGFFTHCKDMSFGDFKPGNKKAFCAWLHHSCTGKWPAEHEGKGKSKEDEINAVHRAWDARFRMPPMDVPISRSWGVDVFENYVIANIDADGKDRFFKVPYSQSGEDVTFAPRDQWQEVEQKKEWVMKARQRRALLFDLESPCSHKAIKFIDEDSRRIGSYATVWGELDCDGERMTRKAIEKYVGKARPLMLWLHGVDKFFGANPVGEWDPESFKLDDLGLYVEGNLGDDEFGAEATKRIKKSNSFGLSVGSVWYLVKRKALNDGSREIVDWPLMDISVMEGGKQCVPSAHRDLKADLFNVYSGIATKMGISIENPIQKEEERQRQIQQNALRWLVLSSGNKGD